MDLNQSINLTQENFAESISQMLDTLSEFKFTPSEINLTNLLVEETFFSLEEGVTNKISAVKMNIYKRFGETKISLRLKGNQYNPLIITPETNEDVIKNARLAILNANRDRITYEYKNGENIIVIVAQRLSKKKKRN